MKEEGTDWGEAVPGREEWREKKQKQQIQLCSRKYYNEANYLHANKINKNKYIFKIS